jgi:hypothetical protein
VGAVAVSAELGLEVERLLQGACVAAVRLSLPIAVADLVAVAASDDPGVVRLVEGARLRYAQRLADPAYAPTGAEFVALARLELQTETSDARGQAASPISEEFRESLRRLPVYLQERILVAAITGVSYEEVLQVQAELDAEDDDLPAG